MQCAGMDNYNGVMLCTRPSHAPAPITITKNILYKPTNKENATNINQEGSLHVELSPDHGAVTLSLQKSQEFSRGYLRMKER